MSRRTLPLLPLFIVASLLLAACGSGAAQGGTVKIVADFPFTGSSFGQSTIVSNAIRQALAEKNNQVCGSQWKVAFEPHDDASATLGQWDEAVVTANAHAYVADPSVAAVIGTLDSGAAKVLIPILNPEHLVIISPANTYPGLTKPGKGDVGEPEMYYPNSERNYARVIPADDIQGAVAAQWAKSLGAARVYILDDGQLYGKGLATVFENAAKSTGLTVLGHQTIDSRATDYKTLAAAVMSAGPDLIYFGGTTQSNAGQLMKDIRASGYTGKIMAGDGIFEQAFLDAAGAAAAEGIYVTFPGIPPDRLTGKAADWRAAYVAKYGEELDVFAVYGYTAAQVLLAAFEQVCAGGGSPLDRQAVRDAVFATRDFDSPLGVFSIDANGDTSLTTMSGSQAKGGKFEFVTLLGAP